MALTDERTREEVAKRLLTLSEPVSLTLRDVPTESCPTSAESRELVETLAELEQVLTLAAGSQVPA